MASSGLGPVCDGVVLLKLKGFVWLDESSERLERKTFRK